MILYLRASRLFSTISTSGSDMEPLLTIDIDYSQKGSRLANGLKAMAPYPWTWTDKYEVNASYDDHSGNKASRSYEFDFETTPINYTGIPEPGDLLPRDGRERMVEKIVLTLLTDLKANGVIQ